MDAAICRGLKVRCVVLVGHGVEGHLGTCGLGAGENRVVNVEANDAETHCLGVLDGQET